MPLWAWIPGYQARPAFYVDPIAWTSEWSSRTSSPGKSAGICAQSAGTHFQKSQGRHEYCHPKPIIQS